MTHQRRMYLIADREGNLLKAFSFPQSGALPELGWRPLLEAEPTSHDLALWFTDWQADAALKRLCEGWLPALGSRADEPRLARLRTAKVIELNWRGDRTGEFPAEEVTAFRCEVRAAVGRM